MWGRWNIFKLSIVNVIDSTTYILPKSHVWQTNMRVLWTQLQVKDCLSLSTPSFQKNIWYIPLPRHQGLGALWQLSKVWCLQELPQYGSECWLHGWELHLWRPCFSLVQLGVLKIDTHPWLVQLHPLVDWPPSESFSYSSYHLMDFSSTFVTLWTTHSQS